MTSSASGRRNRIPTWTDFTTIVTARTFYLSLLILITGIAVLLAAVVVKSSTPRFLLLGLGSTLVTSSVFSLVSEAMVRVDTLEMVQTQFDKIREDMVSLSSQRGGDRGVQVLGSRRMYDFREFVDGAKGHLRVVGFSANDLLSPTNVDRLHTAINLGHITRVEVLLLKPDCAAAVQRSESPSYSSKSSFGSKFQGALIELEDLAAKLTAKGDSGVLSYWLIEDPITISMVADDRIAIVTPVVWQLTGGTSPTFVVAADGASEVIYKTYVQHFDVLKSRVVS
jgi:hypothetical protein